MKRKTAALSVVIAIGITAGCEQGADFLRASLAQRRDSWSRELSGLKEQQAALAARLDERLGTSRGGPAAMRTRAVLDGARQSIVDVDNQLQQAGTRLEQAIRRGGDSGEKALDDESALARGYLQGLGQQLGAVAQQVDGLAQN